MFKYILKTLKYYKVQTLSLLIAFIAIQAGVCTGISSLHQTQVNVSEDIEKYSRDVYDILVRPNDSKISTVEIDKNKLIEPNYLSKGEGGISIEDWKKIQSIQGVEVAAPVASMGFFNNSIDSVKLSLPSDSGAVRASTDFKTTDGYRKYNIFPEDENSDSTVVFIPSSDNLDRPYIRSKSSDVSVVGNSKSTTFLQWLLPPIYNFLVAVDMDSEEKLTGLEFDDVEHIFSEPLKEQPQEGGFYAYEIPVLINNEVKIPIEADIKIEELEEIPDELKELAAEYENLPCASAGEALKKANLAEEIDEKIGDMKATNEKNISLDLSEYLKAFQTTGIVFSPDGNIKTTNQGLMRFAPALEYYTTEGIKYRIENSDGDVVLSPKPIGIKDEQIQYNQLKKKGKAITAGIKEYAEEGNMIFKLLPVGSLNFSGPEGNELVKSPLGIYGFEKFFIEKDENGNQLEKEREIYPTTTLGTYLLPKAHGFTTLEAAKLIKGDKPIDAIRVRVAGIERYDRRGKAKIERVAEEIVRKTGFHVDIVAGSSPRDVKINFSDYEGIQGLGQGVTSWLNLNVSTMVQEKFNLLVL